MSLFGLFGKLTAEDAEKQKRKASKQMARGNEHLALQTIDKLLHHRDCPAEIKPELRTMETGCRKSLCTRNLDLAQAHLEAGELEAAADFAETGLTYATDPETTSSAKAILEQIARQLDRSTEIYHAEEQSAATELEDDDGYADLLLEDYPPFIQDAVTADPDLKKVMIALNRQDMENCPPILDMDVSNPAVRYFQALYLSLNERFDEALSLYRILITEHLDILDAGRVAEFLELLRFAEADDAIEHLVEAVPELPVIRSAAALEAARGNLDDALELTELGKSLMPPTRPDVRLFGMTGIIQYRLKQYEEAVSSLEMFRNMMASRGQLALPPEYSLPLADALRKTERTDEALETALHTVRAYGSPEAFAMARELAPQSTREDLKDLIKRIEMMQMSEAD